MSILKKMRGERPVASIFSSTIGDAEKASLQRMQSNTPAVPKFADKKKFTPPRFYLKKSESAEVIVVDDRFSFSCKEHSLKQDTGYFGPERCISDYDACPLCSGTDSRAFDVAFLTVLDLRSYKNKEGKEVEFTKKLLPVKKADLPSFEGLIQVHGSLRGLNLLMQRGNAEKESSIGKPTFAGLISEEDLLTSFGHEARVSDKGVVIVPENDALNPWNYEKYFPIPTATTLIAKYNIAPRPGSLAEAQLEDDLPPWDTTNVLDLEDTLPEIN